MKNSISDFYEVPNFRHDVVSAKYGSVVMRSQPIPNKHVMVGDDIPEKLKPELASKITELYDSVQPVTVLQDGYEHTFEVGFLPQGSGSSVELRSATYQSSLSGNYGNGFEIAAAAVDEPEKSFLYIASLGMGQSGGLSGKERRYLSKYGRLLHYEDGVVKPLPVVKSLGKLVAQMGLTITSVGSDSAGAVMTMAYGAAYGNGSITSAHQNVRTGVSDLSLIQLGKGMTIDDLKLSKEHAAVSRDALRMSPYITDEFVPQNISSTYKGKNYKSKKSPAMLWTYANGLRRGQKHGDPLLADNIAFARANPGANILFTVGSKDSLAESENLESRINGLLHDISLQSDGIISAAILNGINHGPQTHYPQFLRRLAKTVLADSH